MSEKNRLQEFCQKRKIYMPIYNSWSEGPSHQLRWYANVTACLNGENVTIDTIVATGSKTAAEKQAAMIMINHIKSMKNPKKMSRLTKLKNSSKLNATPTNKSNSD